MASRNLVKFFYKLSNNSLNDLYFTKSLNDPHLAVQKLFNTNNSEMNTATEGLIVPIYFLTPEQMRNAIKNNIWVIFVRNPLDRLLSAWMDKFKEKKKNEYYLNLETEMISQVRGSSRKNASDYLTLSEFFTFLKINCHQSWNFDIHWRPMSQLCDVCAIDFDFIGKLETVEKDIERLQNKLKFEREKSRISTKQMKLPSSKTNERRYKELRGKVPRELTEFVLFKIYKNDYELFGYDLQKDIDDVYGTN